MFTELVVWHNSGRRAENCKLQETLCNVPICTPRKLFRLVPAPGPSPQGDVIPPPPDMGAAPQPPAAHPSASTWALCHYFMSPFPGSASRVSHDRRWSCAHALLQPWDAQQATRRGPEQRAASSNSLFSWHHCSVYCWCLYSLSILLYSLIWGTEQSQETETSAMWKKEFFSLNYLCHRLLEQFWMHPLPLKASFPKLLVLAVS